MNNNWKITKSEQYYATGNPIIYAVKRLSDNVEFEIGDLILEQNEISKILWFEQRGKDIVIRIHHTVTKGFSTISISFSKFTKVICTHPENCEHCGWCGYRRNSND